MNPLDQYPAARKVLYVVQWVVNLILGATAIVLTALGESPTWFIITGAVFNFVWSYTGLTAQSNVTPEGLNKVSRNRDDSLVYGDPHDWEGSE